MDLIYLDHNATTPPTPEVVEVMSRALREWWANPSSIHRPGIAVRQKVELAREHVCNLIGCRERELVLTSGGTESCNMAILGSLHAQPNRTVLATSRLEHSAVRETADRLSRRGTQVIWLPNDQDGLIDLNALNDLFAQRAGEIALVSILAANNETGVIQPIEQIGAMCREHGVRFHTDATQWVGKVPIDLSDLPIDLLTFSAHKFHGPKGAGGLFLREGVRLEPQMIGGPHERGRRSGTENVSGVLGMGEAARLAHEWLSQEPGGAKPQAALRDRFERAILGQVPDAVVNGDGAPRMWNTTNIAFLGLEAEPILMMLSERGVCVSAGSACASGSLDPSPVLRALGLDEQRVVSSVRFSISRETTEDEIDRALEIVCETIERLRVMA